MIYYIFKEQIFTIFLSMTHLTALTFTDRIYDYVGGTQGDFKIYELNKKKSLVFEAKRKGIDKNFITFTKDKKYHFNIKYDENQSNKDIEIKQAKKCSLYTLVKETKSYKLFECPKSLFIASNKVKVNGEVLLKNKFLSKGPPLWIDGELIYYKGKVL